jgi:hypothetical protein
MKRRSGISFAWVLLAAIAAVGAVGGLAFHAVPGAKAQAKHTLAAFPLLVGIGEEPGRGAVCPICKRAYRTSEIPPSSRIALSRLLYQKLEKIGTMHVFPNEEIVEALSGAGVKSFEENPVSTSIRLGRERHFDFALIGFIWRFEERIGSALGVERPASVAFDLHLYRVKDAKMVWDERFDETQRPLSENLLKLPSFLRRKASWLTAAELASDGLDQILRRLPGPKELEEQP